MAKASCVRLSPFRSAATAVIGTTYTSGAPSLQAKNRLGQSSLQLRVAPTISDVSTDATPPKRVRKGDAGIGRRIRDARRKLGWNQTRLAEAAGLKQPTISAAESGSDTIGKDALRRIARVVREDVGYLLEGARSVPRELEGFEEMVFGDASDAEIRKALAADPEKVQAAARVFWALLSADPDRGRRRKSKPRRKNPAKS